MPTTTLDSIAESPTNCIFWICRKTYIISMAASATKNAGASCPLLHAVAQLSDSWWAECMLPGLISAKAAGNVALTGKALRDVCQRSSTCLTLPGAQLQQLRALACIPARFPSCKQLRIEVDALNGAHFHLPAALDVLTG
jgi:hypothetical protein